MDVEIGVDAEVVYQFPFACAFICIAVFIICAMRLLLNDRMRKKGIMPPLKRHYKKFNIIMLVILGLVLAIWFTVYTLLPMQNTDFLYMEDAMLLSASVWMGAYMLLRFILEKTATAKTL